MFYEPVVYERDTKMVEILINDLEIHELLLYLGYSGDTSLQFKEEKQKGRLYCSKKKETEMDSRVVIWPSTDSLLIQGRQSFIASVQSKEKARQMLSKFSFWVKTQFLKKSLHFRIFILSPLLNSKNLFKNSWKRE